VKLYHLIAASDWRAAQASGEYRPTSLEKEGFIHLSTSSLTPDATGAFSAPSPEG
jgi:uncharacterized protein (DUF952 family)